MSRRRSFRVDWSYLRWLIESSLRRQPAFSPDVRVEGKINYGGGGLFHDNYFFATDGRTLVLRLAKRGRVPRSKAESIASLVREAETLNRLAKTDFRFRAPELVCMVADESDSPVGFIESCLEGAPFSILADLGKGERALRAVAQVAAAVHQLSPAAFDHLQACPNRQAHLIAVVEELPAAMIDGHPVAATARDWIMAHLPSGPSVVLHGDLLPQNILVDEMKSDGDISVIDWECARLGDPAYDLAIVTRGKRAPLKVGNGLQRLVAMYNEIAERDLAVSAVQAHELVLHLRWWCEASAAQMSGKLEGHGPEQYANKLAALLRRL